MRVSGSYAIVHFVLFLGISAWTQELEVVPDTVVDRFQPSLRAFDTVNLVNRTAGALRVDSITIRLLDGGANPRTADFTACKACPPDSLGAYFYGGWLYGESHNLSLRYLRDSLFLIQNQDGVPVSLSLAPGASAPFVLYYPVNCPVCGRPPSHPGATRYAFTFIASGGSRAVLQVAVDQPSSLFKDKPSPVRSGPGSARDAAGRSNSGAGRAILYPEFSR